MIPISDTSLYRQRLPFVNLTFIAVNLTVFLYELALGNGRVPFFYTYGLIPLEMTGGEEFTGLATRAGVLSIATPLPTWATIFTGMFMHGDLVHFGSNMLYLWVFGDNVEAHMGHVAYFAFYLVAGVAAAWMQIAVTPSSDVPMIGASGAIAGVLGAYFLLFPRSRVRTLLMYFVVTVVRVPAVFLLGFWILLQFWEGLGSLGISAQGGGVAYWAHIGGFAVGALVVAGYRILMRRPVWGGGP